VVKAVVEHFSGNPTDLIAQVLGVSSYITGGYILTNKDSNAEDESEEDKEIDIYRDTPLRYMGYANEVGEAFRPLINVNFVYLGYVLALGYVCADAISKAVKAPIKLVSNFSGTGQNPNQCAINALIEVLMFQIFASVILPGFTINRFVLFLQLCIE